MAAKRRHRRGPKHAAAEGDAPARHRKRRTKRKKSGRKPKRRHGSHVRRVHRGGVGEHHKRRRRRPKKSSHGAARGATHHRAIPVEGLAGAGVTGRYPGPAKAIEHFTTQSWRPSGNQDLNKTDVIHFHMKVRKGQIIR